MSGYAARRAVSRSISALERRLLLGPVVRPDRLVAPAVAFAEEQPEQEHQPARGRPERVALEVEHDVARRRLGQQREARARPRAAGARAAAWHRRRAACWSRACCVNAREHVGRRSGTRELRRQLSRAASSVVTPAASQQRHLVAPQPGDAREVIDRPPSAPRRPAELAELAVVARDRLGRRAARRRRAACPSFAWRAYEPISCTRIDSRSPEPSSTCTSSRPDALHALRCPRRRSTAAARGAAASRCARAWCRRPRSE